MRFIYIVSTLLFSACAATSPVAPVAGSAPSQPGRRLIPIPANHSPAQGALPNPRELRRAALVAHRGEDWVGCAAAYDALRGLPQSAPKATYGAASCYARAGQTDKAIERLAESAALGLHQAGGLEAEPDLVPLHGQRQWPSLVAHFEENLARYLGSVNRELYDMYQADQGDRAEDYESHWQAVNQRDAQRRVRTRAIVAAGDATAADDWYHAAMIMQHGSEREDFGRAHDWAVRAVHLGNDDARWLAAAARDRWLMSGNQPQSYGTQFVKNGDGPWELYTVDPNVTDAERAHWNVPPLSEAKARVEKMNQLWPGNVVPGD